LSVIFNFKVVFFADAQLTGIAMAGQEYSSADNQS